MEDTTVLWHCDDLYPEIVHSWRDERDELTGQDQRFRGRTSMASDGAESGDLSLTLRQPHLSDSGNYTCLIRKQSSGGKQLAWLYPNVKNPLKDL
uniref:Ig-like domain-containing protein n=1 Tax=Lates calcarifer TaxID=8187 RepID=A0A4W6DNB7_LATCA